MMLPMIQVKSLYRPWLYLLLAEVELIPSTVVLTWTVGLSKLLPVMQASETSLQTPALSPGQGRTDTTRVR